MNQIVFDLYSRPVGTYSWTTGFVPLRKRLACRNEEEALRHALVIERRSSSDAGLDFLDDWLYSREVKKH